MKMTYPVERIFNWPFSYPVGRVFNWPFSYPVERIFNWPFSYPVENGQLKTLPTGFTCYLISNK
jgi:hypothetical protein